MQINSTGEMFYVYLFRYVALGTIGKIKKMFLQF